MEPVEMQGPEFLHPANAEELANIAEEALTVLLRGPQPVVVCPARAWNACGSGANTKHR